MKDLGTLRAQLRDILKEDEQIEEGWGTNLAVASVMTVFMSVSALLGTLLYASGQNPSPPDQYCIDEHGHVVLMDYPEDRRTPRPVTVRASIETRQGNIGHRHMTSGDQLVPIFYAGNRLLLVQSINGTTATTQDMATGETVTLPAKHLSPLVDGQLSANRWDILDNFTAQQQQQ